MDLDLNKILRNTIKTGKVYIGSNQTIEMVGDKRAKVVVLASNCPKDVRDKISGKVPVIDYPGIGVELGMTCGKPFAIAAMAVVEIGESDIMAVLNK